MTQLLEQRLASIQDSIREGIVVQADADFLVQFIIMFRNEFNQLDAEHERLKKSHARLLNKLKVATHSKGENGE